MRKFKMIKRTPLTWNIAFGKAGHLIFKPIEFEGKENVDGELERNGVLVSHPWVKAICFITYTFEVEPKIVGMHRHRDQNDSIELFLTHFCDFVNDDYNTNGFKLHDHKKDIPE